MEKEFIGLILFFPENSGRWFVTIPPYWSHENLRKMRIPGRPDIDKRSPTMLGCANGGVTTYVSSRKRCGR